MRLSLFVTLALAFISFECKKNETIIPAPPDPPGRQHGVAWPSLANSAWPMGSHDPQGTGRSPYSAAAAGIVHKFIQGKRVTGSPVIGADGTIYVQSEDSILVFALVALNLDGSVKWKTGLDSLHSRFPRMEKNYSRMIVGSDGTVYTNSLDRAIYAVRSDGTLRWMFTAPEGFLAEEMSLGIDGTLYAISLNKTLYALDADGHAKWTKASGFGYHQNLILSPDGSTLYLQGDPGGLIAVSTNGGIQWVYPGGVDRGHPLLVDIQGNIYAAFRDSLLSLTPSGQLRWAVSFGQWVTAATLDWNGNVCFATQKNDSTGYWYYYCSVDQKGTLRWINRLSYAAPIATICDQENTVYVGEGSDGQYYAFRADGTLKWSLLFSPPIDVSSSPAITVDGTILIPSGSTTDGVLFGLVFVR